uniref:Uncharacterized protein n=1 Tax=Utricularia reniformis TaxID=192314 RepID=A0A1Y0B0Q3_9LAMI|nr:hypothetical protein AEK19_MT0772 [Utricularia reniformis]ART31015.1 hypothetical protein AEK19_MT0772 [Utricularia reniformis]
MRLTEVKCSPGRVEQKLWLSKGLLCWLSERLKAFAHLSFTTMDDLEDDRRKDRWN